MSTQDNSPVSGLIARIRKLLGQRLGVFLVFFGIATFLWFLQALDKTHIAVIDNPVIFKNLPSDQVLITNLPRKLSIEVEAKGFAILRHNWDLSKQPFQIDYNDLAGSMRENKSGKWIRLTLSSYRQKIASQLDNFLINSITPDTITIGFAKMITRKVMIVPDVEFELSKELMLTGPIRVVPDSVELTGPDLVVDTISKVFTAPVRLRKLQESVNRNIGLTGLPPDVSSSVSRVNLLVSVEPYTEKTIKLPIEAINLPDSIEIKTFPSRVSVTFRIGLSQFEQITEKDFIATVNYLDHVAGAATLKVSLNRYPAYTENIRIFPETVDYIIEK